MVLTYTTYIHYFKHDDTERHVMVIQGEAADVGPAAQAAWDALQAKPGIVLITQRP